MEKTNTNVDCLPEPLPLSMFELSAIFSIYFVIWVLLYVEAYALRMRRIISAFYYRRLEKRRVLYLYNDLLKKRVGLLRHMRKKVRKLAKEKKLSEKTSILYSLKKDYPRLCGCLQIFQSSKSYCLICKTPEIPGNFHNCITPGCNFGYCRQCWKDVRRKCYACLESYNTDSDVTSEESDYTDDDELLD
ncbi:E3 ubiquitin-protein ligase DCST1-like [Gigantopelta aegis]|uniref:E3 ubiquitin-protein ligase DCST1-like n=1 Tax=Gigantopelta aegis TaxID=1735272 RepID=UPI001B887CEE|nr:E3 ubiquitin-protein ligase DCST1-like [Gigantopelta aegis]